MDPAFVIGIRGTGHESFATELGEESAELASIETQVVGELGGGRSLPVGQFPEDPDLGQTVGTAQVVAAEEAELPGVEPVEAADRGDLSWGRIGHLGGSSAW
jgi:hypothetical protein